MNSNQKSVLNIMNKIEALLNIELDYEDISSPTSFSSSYEGTNFRVEIYKDAITIETEKSDPVLILFMEDLNNISSQTLKLFLSATIISDTLKLTIQDTQDAAILVGFDKKVSCFQLINGMLAYKFSLKFFEHQSQGKLILESINDGVQNWSVYLENTKLPGFHYDVQKFNTRCNDQKNQVLDNIITLASYRAFEKIINRNALSFRTNITIIDMEQNLSVLIKLDSEGTIINSLYANLIFTANFKDFSCASKSNVFAIVPKTGINLYDLKQAWYRDTFIYKMVDLSETFDEFITIFKKFATKIILNIIQKKPVTEDSLLLYQTLKQDTVEFKIAPQKIKVLNELLRTRPVDNSQQPSVMHEVKNEENQEIISQKNGRIEQLLVEIAELLARNDFSQQFIKCVCEPYYTENPTQIKRIICLNKNDKDLQSLLIELVETSLNDYNNLRRNILAAFC